MKRFKLVGAKEPEKWGWHKNPVNGVPYTFDELEEMYGESEWLIETVISLWEDEEWDEYHGKWIEVSDEQ